MAEEMRFKEIQAAIDQERIATEQMTRQPEISEEQPLQEKDDQKEISPGQERSGRSKKRSARQ